MVVQGPGADFYDGFIINIFDLDRKKCIWGAESIGKRRWWETQYIQRNGKQLMLVTRFDNVAPEWQEKEEVIDLESGKIVSESKQNDDINIGWVEGQLLSESGLRCEISETGNEIRLFFKENPNPLRFNPDEKILFAAIADNDSCIAIACESGQMHFLSIIDTEN